MKAIAFWAEAAKVDIEVDTFVLLKGVKVRTLLRDVSVVQPPGEYKEHVCCNHMFRCRGRLILKWQSSYTCLHKLHVVVESNNRTVQLRAR